MYSEPNAYEMLAMEYYDPVRHPTCANFRDCSKLLMQAWLPQFAVSEPVCEVGCGMPLAAELLADSGCNIDRLLLTDSSPSMLMYSEKWRGVGAELVLADAAGLPFADNSIRACIASLGDPYNDPAFWDEMARIVKSFGYILFTTPSFEWASRYRNNSQGCSARDFAEFVLSDGTKLLARSIIHPTNEQVALIERTGRLHAEEVQTVAYSQVISEDISGKLAVAKAGDLPVVTGYLICKYR